MLLNNISSFLSAHIPLHLQESYDNSGLLIGDPKMEIKAALITLDVTEEVIDEAIEKDCNLIIAHHPLIFKGLKSITGKNLVERCVAKGIKNDIAIYAAHTNLDHLSGGVSHALARELGLQNIRILRPMGQNLKKLVTFCPDSHAEEVRAAIFSAGAGHIGNYDSCSYNLEGFGTFRAGEDANPFAGKIGDLHKEPEQRIETIYPVWKEKAILKAMMEAHPYEEVAYDIYSLDNADPTSGPGVIGQLDKSMKATDFLELIREKTGIPNLRYSRLHKEEVKSVALCGGAGSFLIGDARAQGADVFITGDLKYHDFFLAEDDITLVDAGHFETEQFARNILKQMLSEKFPNFAVLISELSTNPVNYL